MQMSNKMFENKKAKLFNQGQTQKNFLFEWLNLKLSHEKTDNRPKVKKFRGSKFQKLDSIEVKIQ